MRPGDRSNRCSPSVQLIGRHTLSFVIVVFNQLALLLIPHCFPSLFLLTQLLLSALLLLLVAGVCKCFRRLLIIRYSAPALVFFNIMLLWAVYLLVVRQAVSQVEDLIFNGQLLVLVVGFFSIVSSDPGLVKYKTPDSGDFNDGSNSKELLLFLDGGDSQVSIEEVSSSTPRVRYCEICKAHIKGFDHHCPAFGNCIGQKNRILFIVLLVGFIAAEVSYSACTYQFTRKIQVGKEINIYEKLAVGTMLFSLLQVLWQVLFLAWHMYCVLFNIKTDEWINWQKYPEFQVVSQPHLGQSSEIRFKNPYDNGILGNLKEFFKEFLLYVSCAPVASPIPMRLENKKLFLNIH